MGKILMIARLLLYAEAFWPVVAVAQFGLPWQHAGIHVMPVPGCNFDGDCYTITGDAVIVRGHGRTVFGMSLPSHAADVWLLTSAIGPVDQDDAIGVDLGNAPATARITLRYCPRNGACAHAGYGSVQDYMQMAVARQVRARADDSRTLPVLVSPLMDGSWHGQRAREFSYAYAGVVHARGQTVFPDRMRCDVVIIPTHAGLFVASYSTREMDFPAGMQVFRDVLASLALAAAAAGPAEPHAPLVPMFPSIKLVAPAAQERVGRTLR